MSNANISDIIPDWFELMSSCIQYLNISNNHIRGKLPKFQTKCNDSGSFSNRKLILSSNKFDGPLSTLPPSTYVLDLSNNLFSGPIPAGDYHEMSVLILSNNDFSGGIPVSLCNAAGKFHVIDLSKNHLSGKIPRCIGNMSLYVLDLSSNNLNGQIPISLGFLQTLEYLQLRNNNFHGELPLSLQNLTDMVNLDLSKNHLSGKIPRCFGSLSGIIVLDLSNNNLHGQIQSSLGFLQRLKYLHLRNNSFHGELPLSLQNLTDMVTLDLGGNAFTGIPRWIGDKLHNLVFLSLQSNNFYGGIPVQLCHLSALRLLNLAQNNITRDIPSCFHNFTAMAALEHGNTHYQENPYSRYEEQILMIKGRELVYNIRIELENNENNNLLIMVKGSELEYTKTLKYVTSIDVSSNGITGEIPEGLTNLSGLWNLNLSRNHLTGRIPEKIGDLNQLESLDLSRNKLFGSIPQSLSSLTYPSHLNLSLNNLSGRIPTGNQLQTLNDRSIYVGNDGLCGAPLTKSCPGDESADDGDRQVLVNEGDMDEDDAELMWFYAGIGLGFVVGLLGVFCILYFKRKWRYAYFQLIEDAYDRIFVAIAVKANWLRQKFHLQR